MILQDRMSMNIFDVLYKHYLENKGNAPEGFEGAAIEISEMIQKMIIDIHKQLTPDMDEETYWKEIVNKLGK